MPFSTDLDNFIDRCEAKIDQQDCNQTIEHPRELSTGIHNGLDFSLSNDFVMTRSKECAQRCLKTGDVSCRNYLVTDESICCATNDVQCFDDYYSFCATPNAPLGN